MTELHYCIAFLFCQKAKHIWFCSDFSCHLCVKSMFHKLWQRTPFTTSHYNDFMFRCHTQLCPAHQSVCVLHYIRSMSVTQRLYFQWTTYQHLSALNYTGWCCLGHKLPVWISDEVAKSAVWAAHRDLTTQVRSGLCWPIKGDAKTLFMNELQIWQGCGKKSCLELEWEWESAVLRFTHTCQVAFQKTD